MVSAQFGSELPTVMARLGGIPNTYLNHLVANYNAGLFKGISPQSYKDPRTAGMTELIDGQTEAGNSGFIAISISTRPGSADFSLQHEIGHGAETLIAGLAARRGIRFSQRMRSMLMELALHRDVIRPYALTDVNEAFAEAFANYYCSPESKQFIENRLSKATAPFLKAVLEPPHWESGFNQPPEVKAGEIFVALEPITESTEAYIRLAAEAAVTHLSLCQEPKESCLKREELADTAALEAHQVGRLSMSQATRIALSSLSTGMTLLGYNASGKLIAHRSLRTTH
jgi:hypothetical protein